QEELIDVKIALESFVKLPPPEKYEELKTADFDSYRIQLPGMLLQKAQLQNAKLAGANLRGANLSDADLSGADLKDAILDDTVFNNTI
ncbi:MAG: pentapeptide repeat-containing protein, partial [Alphaproteobacteria bacterium]|nr:pentapeptide repeat-containing protein [Alphaproteobacteria bacterium]